MGDPTRDEVVLWMQRTGHSYRAAVRHFWPDADAATTKLWVNRVRNWRNRMGSRPAAKPKKTTTAEPAPKPERPPIPAPYADEDFDPATATTLDVLRHDLRAIYVDIQRAQLQTPPHSGAIATLRAQAARLQAKRAEAELLEAAATPDDTDADPETLFAELIEEVAHLPLRLVEELHAACAARLPPSGGNREPT